MAFTIRAQQKLNKDTCITPTKTQLERDNPNGFACKELISGQRIEFYYVKIQAKVEMHCLSFNFPNNGLVLKLSSKDGSIQNVATKLMRYKILH